MSVQFRRLRKMASISATGSPDGLSTSKLAAVCGVDSSVIARMEDADDNNVNEKVLRGLARLLSTSPTTVLGFLLNSTESECRPSPELGGDQIRDALHLYHKVDATPDELSTAVQSLKQIAAMAPNADTRAIAWLRIGGIKNREGDFQAERAAFEAGLRIRGISQTTRFRLLANMAIAQFGLQNYDLAMQCAQDVIKLIETSTVPRFDDSAPGDSGPRPHTRVALGAAKFADMMSALALAFDAAPPQAHALALHATRMAESACPLFESILTDNPDIGVAECWRTVADGVKIAADAIINASPFEQPLEKLWNLIPAVDDVGPAEVADTLQGLKAEAVGWLAVIGFKLSKLARDRVPIAYQVKFAEQLERAQKASGNRALAQHLRDELFELEAMETRSNRIVWPLASHQARTVVGAVVAFPETFNPQHIDAIVVES